MLTIYDWHGNYGHPDHIQVHRVGVRAAEMVADDLPALRVFEATLNRDAIAAMIAAAAEAGTVAFGDEDEEFDPNGPADDGNPFGMSEAELTHEVDVSDYVGAKRSAIASHRSQVTDTGFFLTMPEEMFANGVPTGSGSSNVVVSPGCVPAGCSTNDRRPPGVPRPPRAGGGRLGPRSDPDLDELGRAQATAAADRFESLAAPEPLAVITSPLQRCRRTAAALVRSVGGSPLGSRPRSPRSPRPKASRWWSGSSGCGPRRSEPGPSSASRTPRFATASSRASGRSIDDTVVFSHFVAINAVIGACVGDDRLVIRRLDNCSITVVDVEADGRLTLVEGGHEADTLIR